MRVDRDALAARLDQCAPAVHHLFAYPAQSNFSGAQHPLDWIPQAQEQGLGCAAGRGGLRPDQPAGSRTLASRLRHTLLLQDLRLSDRHRLPAGAQRALPKLRRPWFAGGTISIASVQGEGWHHLLPDEAGFEDGTVNYLNLPAVEIGLQHIAAIGMETIHTRVACLTGWLLEALQALHHRNGSPLVRIHGPADMHRRGGTIACNFYDPEGQPHDYRRIETLAQRRTSHCAPGVFATRVRVRRPIM